MSKLFEYGIIGMGPAGIGVAMSLSEQKYASNTICFEQGYDEDNDQCTSIIEGVCCNRDSCLVISGIGGASNKSSGKISNYPAGSKLVEFYQTDNELKNALNNTIDIISRTITLRKKEISAIQIQEARKLFKERGLEYKYYDVYEFQGSEYQRFIKDTVSEMEQLGLTVYRNAKVISIEKDNNDNYLVKYVQNDHIKTVSIHKLVIATGALNVQDPLISEIEDKKNLCFEIGVRIEAPANTFGAVFQTHGDLKLKNESGGRTYCITENGIVVTYKVNDYLFLEGCKTIGQGTSFSNFAVLVKRNDSSELDKILSNYKTVFNSNPIRQKYNDYMNGGINIDSLNTTCRVARTGDINLLFPSKVNSEIKQFLQTTVSVLNLPENELTILAPELKMLRHIEISQNFETKNNLFVIGAATGKFRGILQSLCSGIKCGQVMVRR